MRQTKFDKVEALIESAKATLASAQELATQFRTHQKLRQHLQTSLEELLREHSDLEDSPAIIALESQIAELKAIENAIIEGLRLLQSVGTKVQRGQAELVPSRRNGQSEEEGFYFPRR